MSRARLALVAAGLLAAAASLAFVRTTDSSTKVCLYWGPRTVHYSINYGKTIGSTLIASPTCSQGGAEQTAITTAFSQWTGAVQSCTDLSLVFDGPSTNPVGYDRTAGAPNQNTIAFRSGWCSVVASGCTDGANTPISQTCANLNNCFEDNAENTRDTLALTTTTYNQNTGEILDADTELNGWDGVGGGTSSSGPLHGWYFTCTAPTTTICGTYGQDGCAYVDVQNTVTHEAGHFIGLAHAPRIASQPVPTMYAYSAPGDFDLRSLEQDDINGLCAIYPKNAATVTCGDAPHHSGGCASGGAGAGASALLLAAAALLPRLRRRRA